LEKGKKEEAQDTTPGTNKKAHQRETSEL